MRYQTISALVKETIVDRKNSSPQTTYETTQQYAAGALKVACVGLQCVGFNQELYQAIIQYSIKFGETKWKAQMTSLSPSGSQAVTPSTMTPLSSGGPSTPSTPPNGFPFGTVTPTAAPPTSGSKVVAVRNVATVHRAPGHAQPLGLSPQSVTPSPIAAVASPSHGSVASSVGLGTGKSPLAAHKSATIPPLNLGASASSIWSTTGANNNGPGADLTAPGDQSPTKGTEQK